MKKHFLYIIFFTALFNVQRAHAQLQVDKLTCEWRVNPAGIDIVQPHFSWQLQCSARNTIQESYQILVASSLEKLQRNEADVWNSGRQVNSKSIQLAYAGKPLQSGKVYYWKVGVVTNHRDSAWSGMASWSMGMLKPADWKAKWIGYDKASPWDSISTWSRLSARYLRKSFSLPAAIKRATAYVSGLGLYELYVNGKKIGDQVLAPAPTDYRKSVLYNTYDLTSELAKGDNAIGVILGNGRFFTMRQAYKPKKINTFGFPKLLLQVVIEYTNGRTKFITSDESWALNVDGPIRTNNEYDGEEYDAGKEWANWTLPGFDDKTWMKAELTSAPKGNLHAQLNPPMRIMKTIAPVAIYPISGHRYILDMGQNFAGWLKLTAHGPAGTRIVLKFAESLKPDGTLYTANLRDAHATDVYTMKGDGDESWQPRFVYHGFRYVEISGFPGEPTKDNFEGELVYDDLPTTGIFSCADTTINAIVRNAWWGIASDYKGMPIDCPQRNERQPWLGDRATGSTGESFLFNNVSLYSKWLDDIEESQTPEGAIPDVAPAFWNYYSDNVTWPGTYILVANMIAHQFGDNGPALKHYASMKKWMTYMHRKYMVADLLTKDKYGDWCVPPESLELIRSKDSLRNTNGELLATAYYYRLLGIMKKFAVLAHRQQDAVAFEQLAVRIKTAFNRKFFNPSAQHYDNNTVTANLLPLYFDMVDPSARSAVFNSLYQKLQADGMHISTGVIGTQWLMRGLTVNGMGDAAFTLASNTTYPSWGYMVKQGATTIWELWNGNTASPQMNSQNHVMLLGDFLIWVFEDLAGIKSAPDADNGFKKMIMSPCFPEKLNEAKANYDSPYGKVGSSWTRTGNQINWSITIPANSSAEIFLPAKDAEAVTESDKALALSARNGINKIEFKDGKMKLELGSGEYHFVSLLK